MPKNKESSYNKIITGYQAFKNKYTRGDNSIMQSLADNGQQPHTMILACCDSRVDPALILQCDPGDLFVVRNVANIIPPYEKDEAHHGVSAALEFGICFLNIKHLIILGHSQCGGINALLNQKDLPHNDFITNWMSLINMPHLHLHDADDYAKAALIQSYQHCLTFPWIKEKVAAHQLAIHLWFFDIKQGEIFTYSQAKQEYHPLC